MHGTCIFILKNYTLFNCTNLLLHEDIYSDIKLWSNMYIYIYIYLNELYSVSLKEWIKRHITVYGWHKRHVHCRIAYTLIVHIHYLYLASSRIYERVLRVYAYTVHAVHACKSKKAKRSRGQGGRHAWIKQRSRPKET